MKQFCTFKVDGHFFGVEVAQVQEVMRHQNTEHVPLAPAVIKGLINLRGEIVTAIDLRTRLRLTLRAESSVPMHVVIRTEQGPVSLLVDEIGDVMDVAEETFEAPPEALQGPAKELITGAHKLEGKLLLVLDTKKTTDLTSLAA